MADLTALRAQVSGRPEQPQDRICEAIGAAVSEALATGQFQELLAESGWALAYIGDGTCPEPPEQWLMDGLDNREDGWIDPIGRLLELWQSAWEAGRRVGLASALGIQEGGSK